MKNRAGVLRPDSWRAPIARAGSILAAFLLSLAIVRTLTLTESGTFFLVYALLAVFATAGRFGTDNLAIKLSGGKNEGLGLALPTLWTMCSAAAIISTAIALGALMAMPEGFLLDRSTAFVASAAVVPQALSVLAGSALRGGGWLAIGVIAELGSLPVLTTLFLFVWRLFAPVGIMSAVMCLVCASWVTALWSVIAAHRWIADRASTRPRRVRLFFRRYSGRLAPMMGTALLFYGLTWVPVFVLTVANAPDDVSLFTAANRLAGFIVLVPTIQVSSLGPRFAVLLRNGRLDELNELCRRSALLALATTVAPGLLFVVAGGTVMGFVFGPDFSTAGFGLAALSVLGLLTVWAGQINQLMLLSGREKIALVSSGTLVLMWALLGLPLATWGGLNAVCVLTLVAGVAYLVVSILVLRRQGIVPTARLISRG